MDEKLEGKSKRGGKRPGSGRKKGIPNKLNALLKDAIIDAADEAGGVDGVRGYLREQAKENPGPFMALLGKVLPMQITGNGGGPIEAKVTLSFD